MSAVDYKIYKIKKKWFCFNFAYTPASKLNNVKNKSLGKSTAYNNGEAISNIIYITTYAARALRKKQFSFLDDFMPSIYYFIHLLFP